MERMIIDEPKRRTYIDIDKRSLMGNTIYQDGRVEPLTSDVLSILQAFILSDNYKELPNEGEYKVKLDNETGFKHYFLNGKESYIMFFLNNGEDGKIYKDNDKKSKTKKIINDKKPEKFETLKEKVFTIGDAIVRCTCLTLLITLFSAFATNAIFSLKNPDSYKDFGPYPVISYFTGDIKKNYEADELIKKIHDSEVLGQEEQIILANKDFLEDIMPYVNNSLDAKFSYSERFRNIHVAVHPHNENYIGFYRPADANCLYLSEDILSDDKAYNNTLTHEFIHLCQSASRYNVLVEATAEILSYEYFEDSPLTSYPDEVYLTRKLMEIVGPEAVLHYVIGNNFSYIENAIKPLLSNDEYKEFLNDLSRPNKGSLFYSEEKNQVKFSSLDKLLDKAYRNKYGIEASEDAVMPHLRNPNLSRYYFNHRKMTQELSYLSMPNFVEEHLSLKEAYDEGYVYMTQKDDDGNEVRVSYQDYMDSKYDWNKDLIFNLPQTVPSSLYLGEDNKIHVTIIETDGEKRDPLPTINERNIELDAITR